MLTLKAFAKVNLVLEVLGRRADGYHEIASIMQTVSLYDVLTLEPASHIKLICNLPGLPDHTNIVLKAAEALVKFAGCSKGAVIGLEKNIPVGAGLGGGSSDAAAVLRGLNKLWQLELTREQLAVIGVGLGSDVPFFIYGGTCLVEGRGERVTPLAGLDQAWFVLLRPDLAVSPAKTATLYRLVKPGHYTSGDLSAGMRELFEKRGERKPGPLYNVFEKVAPDAFPGVGKYVEGFRRAGAPEIHLAGSGPVLFTLLHDERQAADIHANLLAGGLESYLVMSVGGEEIDC
ncbi:MAG: 4-(cytidine 5'-diphospho)-2-C-methyl-D-erythritol kinase [Dehalococcoidia bacterium]|nr:MAG: 4-(cytidine 5'-diphospho)-2-C-methyl-D-erythritol kinase [Dehalococcoidia bacterium]